MTACYQQVTTWTWRASLSAAPDICYQCPSTSAELRSWSLQLLVGGNCTPNDGGCDPGAVTVVQISEMSFDWLEEWAECASGFDKFYDVCDLSAHRCHSILASFMDFHQSQLSWVSTMAWPFLVLEKRNLRPICVSLPKRLGGKFLQGCVLWTIVELHVPGFELPEMSDSKKINKNEKRNWWSCVCLSLCGCGIGKQKKIKQKTSRRGGRSTCYPDWKSRVKFGQGMSGNK